MLANYKKRTHNSNRYSSISDFLNRFVGNKTPKAYWNQITIPLELLQCGKTPTWFWPNAGIFVSYDAATSEFVVERG